MGLSSLHPSDYFYLGQYRCPLIYSSLCQSWADAELAQRFGLPVLDSRILFLDGHLFLYKSDRDELVRVTRAAIERGEDGLWKRLFACLEEVKKKTLETAEALAHPTDPAAACEQFFAAVYALEFPWFALLPVAEAFEQVIREELERAGRPLADMEYFLGVARPTLFMQHREELARLRRDSYRMSAEGRSRALQEHVRKFEWVGMMHFWGTPLTVEACLEQLGEKNKKEDARILKPAPLDGKLAWLRAQTLELSYWRQHAAEVCSLASLAFRKGLEAWGSGLGVTYDDALWLTPAELLEALRGRGFSQVAIAERARAYGMYFDGGETHIVTGDNLQKLLERFDLVGTEGLPPAPLDKGGSNRSEPLLVEEGQGRSGLVVGNGGCVLKGMAACKGKAVGRAKVIRSPGEMNKMQTGDILVAPETTPDLMLVLQKAKAVVTDMGGITSHAAIVSRELGIPCVVGTRIATRLIRDNDLIEVDAERGSVILLEKYDRTKTTLSRENVLS